MRPLSAPTIARPAPPRPHQPSPPLAPPIGDERRTPPPLPHRPALDGLRGLAVLAVLLFHAGYPWARGGYLGVTVFFTLSGFLITSLLLREAEAPGGVRLKRFWSRRARRLLPASFAGIALALWLTAATGSVDQSLRLDALAAMLDVANWRFLFAGQSYADLFGQPSPLLHYWSLAIEEQLYLVIPLVVVVAARGGRRRVAGVFGLMLVGSLVLFLGLLATGHRDAAYFATPARAGEVLAGGLLAVTLVAWPAERVTRWSRRSVAGPAALAGLALLVALAGRGRSWSYPIGIPLAAGLTVVVIRVAMVSRPFARSLAVRPLVGLGRISYGVYVYHWPIFVWLTRDRTGLDTTPLLVVRLVATFALAVLSYVLLEQPIRAGRAPRVGHAVAGASAFAVGCSVTLVVAGLPAPSSTDRLLQDLERGGALEVLDGAPPPLTAPVTVPRAGASTTAPAGTLPPEVPDTTAADPAADPAAGTAAGPAAGAAPTTIPATTAPATVPPTTVPPPPPPPPRVFVVGDSTAIFTGRGLARWGGQSGALAVVGGTGYLGCGLNLDWTRIVKGEVESDLSYCRPLRERWITDAAAAGADTALVQYGPWEVVDVQVPGEQGFRHVGDPLVDDELRRLIDRAMTDLDAAGLVQIWVAAPAIAVGRLDEPPPPSPYPESDPARMARYNELVREVAAAHPRVRVVELSSFLQQSPGGELDSRLRPDGVHFTEDAAEWVAGWLGPEVVTRAAAARQG